MASHNWVELPYQQKIPGQRPKHIISKTLLRDLNIPFRFYKSTFTTQNTGNSFVQRILDVPARTNKACCTIRWKTQTAVAV